MNHKPELLENFGNAYDHLETEIVLRKRPLEKKVRLFNFGNSSQTSATVVNFCNGSQTLEMGIRFSNFGNGYTKSCFLFWTKFSMYIQKVE